MTESKNLPCEAHQVQLNNHKDRLDKIDIILEKVRNRLPVWATLAIAALLGFIGYLLRAANGG